MVSSKTARRQDILNAALLCFNEVGVSAATVDMIRARSGASVGSLYHHFANKDAIADALYELAMEDHFRYQSALLEQAADAESMVKAIALAYVDWVGAHPDLARFALHRRGASPAPGPEGGDDSGRQRRLGALLARFAPLIEDGAIRALPLECYGPLMTGPAHDYARLWLSGRVARDIRDHREVFASAAWSALRPDAASDL
jgi:AcrR family transcriptional regulator